MDQGAIREEIKDKTSTKRYELVCSGKGFDLTFQLIRNAMSASELLLKIMESLYRRVILVRNHVDMLTLHDESFGKLHEMHYCWTLSSTNGLYESA